MWRQNGGALLPLRKQWPGALQRLGGALREERAVTGTQVYRLALPLHTQEHLWANDLASLILVSSPEEEGPGQHTPRGAGWGLSDMPCGEGSA